MKIGIQLTPEGRRFEFDLIPINADTWYFNPFGYGRANRCNNAGLIAAFQIVRQTAEQTAHQQECEHHRCVLDFPWQCSHYPDFPCKHATRRNQQKLAIIGTSNYASVLLPIGQMSLFEPHITHRQAWQHYITGKTITQSLRPFNPAVIVCKEMAIAAMEWLKHDQGWNPLVWKIRPLDEGRKTGEDWAEAMAARYTGRYPPCTFHLV